MMITTRTMILMVIIITTMMIKIITMTTMMRRTKQIMTILILKIPSDKSSNYNNVINGNIDND